MSLLWPPAAAQKLVQAKLIPLLLIIPLRHRTGIVIVRVKIGRWQVKVVVPKVVGTPLVVHEVEQRGRLV